MAGLGAYVVVRPPRPPRRGRQADVSSAAAIVAAAERRQRGELTDAEYLTEIADDVSVD